MQLFTKLNSLIRTGADGVAPEYEDQVIVVNTLSIMTAFLAVSIGTAIALRLGDVSIFVAAWLELIFFSGFVLLNYYHRHMTAAIAFLAVHNIGILYFGVWKGMVIEEEMLTVFLIITALLILKQRWQVILSIAITCGSLALAKINQRTGLITGDRVRDPGHLFHDWGMVALFIMIVTAISFFKRYVLNLIGQLRKTNENLDLLVQQRTAELEQANKNLNLFFRAIAHDINDELCAQLTMSGLIAKEIKGDSRHKRLQDLVGIQYAASNRVSALVGNILDLRRIEAGDFDVPRPVNGNLHHWAHEVVESLQFNAHARLVKIVLVIDQLAPQYIKADFRLLEKVIKNLLSNAIKFTRENGLVFLNIAVKDNLLTFEIMDQGSGIPKEKQSAIFDLYVTERYQGTGLGLHIVARTVETLGGQIDMESEMGKGSIFRVKVPFTSSLTQDFGKEPAAPVTMTFDHKVTVLVVDDNEQTRKANKLVLGTLQCNVLMAIDGTEGLALARTGHPDLVLLDACLPGLSGHEVLTRLRQDPALKDIPVIISTGDRSIELIEQFQPAPDDFLFKPFSALALTASINRVMGLKAIREHEKPGEN